MTPPVVVTIAGSDSGAGAGIQADLKTFAALRVYGTSVITAVTAQNTREVASIHPLAADVVAAQLDAVLADFRVAATKVGMLATTEIAEMLAVRARGGRLPNLVLDPVLTSSSRRRLSIVEAITPLLPYATVITPNRVEASELLDRPVGSLDQMAAAAAELGAAGPPVVVVTGGDSFGEESIDVVWTADGGAQLLRHPQVHTRHTHGTGCTFAAAITARLAVGDDPLAAVGYAKQYVSWALVGAREWTLGAGPGPLDHFGWSA